jgi:hypothetical protein
MGDRLPLYPAISAPRRRRRGTGDGGGDDEGLSAMEVREGKNGGRKIEDGGQDRRGKIEERS